MDKKIKDRFKNGFIFGSTCLTMFLATLLFIATVGVIFTYIVEFATAFFPKEYKAIATYSTLSLLLAAGGFIYGFIKGT